jgi:PAP2 superfamily
MNRKNNFKKLVLFAIIAIAISACKKDSETNDEVTPVSTAELSSYNNRVVSDWQNTFLVIERNAAVYRPCPAARMLGYVGLAAYEASVSGMPNNKSIANLYPGLSIPAIETDKAYHYPTVLNNVYASLFRHFFATVQASDKIRIDSVEAALNAAYAGSAEADVLDRSKIYGLAVAEAVWNYSATDAAGHDKYLDPRPSSYAPPVGTGLWKPTPPGNQAAMFPYWGSVRTFAISGVDKLCKPPIPYSTSPLSPYYAQALEVYSHTTPQTAEEKWIAEFWSDDVLGFTFSPPSRWIAITNEVLEIENSNLETAVIIAVKMGLALNDASVGCWNSKYVYNIERPVTYIHEVMGHTSWNVYDLTSTHFLTSTPSFPAYPSGHSTFGAAAAEVLSSVFGYNYQLTDRCYQSRTDFNGTPRSFNSFYEMAEENGISRVYLGVHFPMDCNEGVRYGYFIGQKVNALPFRK